MAVSAVSQSGPSTGMSFTSFSAGIRSRRAFSRQSPASGKFVMLTHSAGWGQRPNILMTRPVPVAVVPSAASWPSAPGASGFFSWAFAQAARAPSTASLTTDCAEVHHLSTTHFAVDSASLGFSGAPGNKAWSSKACGPHRSQKAAASIRTTSSHVGSEAQRSMEEASSPKSLRASVRWPCASSSSAWPAVSWNLLSRRSWTLRTRSASDHRERLQAVATRRNCCESQVTTSVAARKPPTGKTEPCTASTKSVLTLHGAAACG
mmetsp:Transcript_49085/g.153662  ORF Transcript_49085/g.153662 Transcript_49085/m.153662 type:complete len:263 (-) Transcript_49085:346-1134(-)